MAESPARGRAVRLGVSSCLLGRKVRYDGGDKYDRFVSRTLGKYFEFIPICPEVAIGLGVPRAPIHLAGNPRAPRAVGVNDPALDVTTRLAAYGKRMARELGGVSGYVFKSRSPSCGLRRVPVGRRRGQGLYAKVFLATHPLLPAEEEDGLHDPARRDNFLERVFAYRRWQDLVAAGLTPARLSGFHAAHRLALMAHGARHYPALGRLLRARGPGMKAQAQGYFRRFMRALEEPATTARHAAVLRYIAGRVEKRLRPAEAAKLRETIRAYRGGSAALAAPLKLIRRHLRRHPDPALADQVYLHPTPRELALRHGIRKL